MKSIELIYWPDPVLLSNDLLEPKNTRSTVGYQESLFKQSACSMSIKESARMAQTNNFMGLMVQSRVLVSKICTSLASLSTNRHFSCYTSTHPFNPPNASQEMVPALVDTIKELGLVLVADTSHEKTESNSGSCSTEGWSAMPEGVNGILKPNGILRFHDTIDM